MLGQKELLLRGLDYLDPPSAQVPAIWDPLPLFEGTRRVLVLSK